MSDPIFRLTLDVPKSECITPPLRRAVHCKDFAPSSYTDKNVIRDNLTSLIMLRPSVLDRSFADDMKALDQWTHIPAFWQAVKRAQDAGGGSAPMLSTISAAGQPRTLIEILTQTAIVAIEANEALADDMKWALQSKFFLARDEGFAIHYHGLNDEILRKSNWFGVRWHDLFLHFNTSGEVRVYQYADPMHLEAPPKLLETFLIARPGEMLGTPGYFHFIPAPEFGLLLYHRNAGQSLVLNLSNSAQAAASGKWIRLKTRGEPGNRYLFERSLVEIALNPHQSHVVGFSTLRYPSSGVFVDGVLDPGFIPAVAPEPVTPLLLKTGHESVTGQFRKTDNSGVWNPEGDRQGRVALTLSTSDARYTPFVTGYGVNWHGDFAPRGTTPLAISSNTTNKIPSAYAGAADRLLHLEFTEDEYSQFDGQASLLLSSEAGRLIAERGDTTFLLEGSEDDGDTWAEIAGGWAKVENILYHDRGFPYYEVDLTLYDAHFRLEEIHQSIDTAFDGMRMGDAFNVVFLGAGFAAINPPPPALQNFIIPPSSDHDNWAYGVNVNDSNEKILNVFLRLLRTQGNEYRCRYAWGGARWYVEPKPKLVGADAWTLTTFPDEQDIPGHVLPLAEGLRMKPVSPEANVISVWGVTKAAKGHASTVLVKSAPFKNMKSLNDATSPDYLGRVVPFVWEITEAADQHQVNVMARVVAEAVMHRRLKMEVPARRVCLGLVPNTQVTVRARDASGARVTLFASSETQGKLWVKSRTITVPQSGPPTMKLRLDDRYIGELK